MREEKNSRECRRNKTDTMSKVRCGFYEEREGRNEERRETREGKQ